MTPGVAANVLALAGVAGWLLHRALPASEAVRLRNAFLLDPGSEGDFAWPPDAVPTGFMLERRQPDPFFVDIVDRLGVRAAAASDWDRALLIARHLVENARDLGPIRARLRRSYRRIREGFGYCADHARVFIALAHAANLPVRQWGFSFDGFGGHGHTIVEIFDRHAGKWLLLDVYNNIHAVDAATGERLSALEVRAAFRGERAPAALVRNGAGRLGFRLDAKALEYYRQGNDGWYLVWGNAIYSYDAHPLVGLVAGISRTLADLIASVVGVRPRLRVYATPTNTGELAKMRALRGRLRAVGALVVLLVATLAIQLVTAQDQRNT